MFASGKVVSVVATDGSRPATMADVARLAGVSHQTVSRVLNEHANVRPATRERVLNAIRQLDYRRNMAARTLVTRRSQMLGVVTFDTTLYGPASTLFGLEQAAREIGYAVSIVSVRRIDRQAMAEAVTALADQAVAGIIVIAPQRIAVEALNDLRVRGARGRIPLVAVEGDHSGKYPVVAVDQNAGARLVTNHLLDLGHTTVWHVAGPPDWLEAQARVTGWEAALAERGAPVPEPLTGDWSPASGYRAGEELAARLAASSPGVPAPTAVFVANDQMALGMLRAFHERGIRVPEDISVAGFDDIPEAAYLIPPLTTIRQDFGEVGRRSMSLLLSMIDAPEAADVPQRVVVPPRLVIRDSTAPPHRSDHQ